MAHRVSPARLFCRSFYFEIPERMWNVCTCPPLLYSRGRPVAAVTPVVALAERRAESQASLTSSGDMRRREKRLLQVAGLLLAALLFLPNVGLWSLYRDRAFYNSPNTDGPGGILPLQVRRARRVKLGFFQRLIHGYSTKTSQPTVRCSKGSTGVMPPTSEAPAAGTQSPSPAERLWGSGAEQQEEASQPRWLVEKYDLNSSLKWVYSWEGLEQKLWQFQHEQDSFSIYSLQLVNF